MAEDTERFIDTENDTQKYGQQESYESIVTRQISECVRILSQPLNSQTITRNKTNSQIDTSDRREEVINSVDTLRMLMSPFIEAKSDSDKIYKETNQYIEEFSNNIILEDGVKIKIKDSKRNNIDSLHWIELLNYKTKQARKLFEALIGSYHANKTKLAQFSMDS
jgi:hypothetical protein